MTPRRKKIAALVTGNPAACEPRRATETHESGESYKQPHHGSTNGQRRALLVHAHHRPFPHPAAFAKKYDPCFNHFSLPSSASNDN